MLTRIGLGVTKRNTLSVTPKLTSRLTIQALRAYSTPTTKASADEELEILKNQRKARPISPHLQIYKPQLTWVLSGLHRVTGVAMAFPFYALTCGYAAATILNYPLDVDAVVAAFAGLPLVVKAGIKATMAFPFVFHSFNGLRHLVWDSGKELTVKGVYRTGYVVLGLTGVIGSYLAFLY